MEKYICPICDKVMKGNHFCHSCRSWVKEPNVAKIDYYLNERHPVGETNCDYHNEYMHPTLVDPKKGTSTTKKQSTQKKSTDSYYQPQRPSANQSKPLDPMLEISKHMQDAGRKFSASMHTDLNPGDRTGRNTQTGKSSGGWVAIVIFLLFSLITSC